MNLQYEPAQDAANMIACVNEALSDYDIKSALINALTRIAQLEKQAAEAVESDCRRYCQREADEAAQPDRTAAMGAAHQPVTVAGLGRITNEDDGFLTLQFKDEDAAQQFFDNYTPSVESDEMPPMRPTASGAAVLPYTEDDLLELIGLAGSLREIKHWQAQAGSKQLAQFVQKLNEAIKNHPAATGEKGGAA